MILVAAALACVLAVPLSGGRLGALAELEIRAMWTIFAALGLQVAITVVVPAGSASLHQVIHLVSYALAGVCIVANRHIVGLPILAAGAALNAMAILVNHGVMPASARAMALAGRPPAAHFGNSAAIAHPHLLALGDVIPIPGPWPLGNVVSVGDVLIIAGLFVVLRYACRAPSPTVARA